LPVTFEKFYHKACLMARQSQKCRMLLLKNIRHFRFKKGDELEFEPAPSVFDEADCPLNAKLNPFSLAK